jgi:NADH-quinone oxidoreductase subunit A
MQNILLSPPVAFAIMLTALIILSYLASFWSINRKERRSEAYSCGEEFEGHMIQPDYSQFFPFAFFFTVLHVVALVIATIPVAPDTITIALVYILVASVGLLTLLRR